MSTSVAGQPLMTRATFLNAIHICDTPLASTNQFLRAATPSARYVLQMESLGIASVLDQLWDDLEEAQARVNRRIKRPMAISSASVEIAFTVNQSATRARGFSLQVAGLASASASKQRSDQSEIVHRVTITLESVEQSVLLSPAGVEFKRSLFEPPRQPAAKKAPARKAPAKKAAKRPAAKKAAKRPARRAAAKK